MPLIRAASGLIALSSASGPVEQAALDLAALGHLAQGCGLDGAGNLGVDGLDRGEDGDAGGAEAKAQVQVDGVAADVGLGLEVGEDVDGGVGDEERLGVARHVHDEDVADPAGGAQARLAGHDLAHQLVGVQAALHQELGPAGPDQLHGLGGSGVAVRHVHDLEGRDVDAERLRHAADLVLGPDQDGGDDLVPGRLDGTTERGLVAGVGHGAGDGPDLAGGGDQPLVLVVAPGCWLGHLGHLRKRTVRTSTMRIFTSVAPGKIRA